MVFQLTIHQLTVISCHDERGQYEAEAVNCCTSSTPYVFIIIAMVLDVMRIAISWKHAFEDGKDSRGRVWPNINWRALKETDITTLNMTTMNETLNINQ